MDIAFYDNETDNVPTCVQAPWDEVVDLLCTITETDCAPCSGKDCRAKFGQAWSPVRIEGTRANANVKAVTVAVFDLDNVDDDELAKVFASLDGYEYVLHSTHTHLHAGPGHSYLRLVMPLSRDVLPAEWARVLPAAIVMLKLPADPYCKDLSRLYFLPTRPRGAESLTHHGIGRSLDVDALLTVARALPSHQVPAAVYDYEDEIVVEAGEVSVDLADLRKRLGQLRRHKMSSTRPGEGDRLQILTAINKGEPLAVPGDFEGATDRPRGRDSTINKAAALLAFAFPAETPVDAAIEVLRPSIVAMDCEPEGAAFWVDKARRSYERAQVRRAESDRIRVQTNSDIHARLQAFARTRSAVLSVKTLQAAAGQDPTVSSAYTAAPAEQNHTASHVSPTPSTATAVSGEPTDPDAPNPDAWMEQLITRADGQLKACGENAYVVLAESPETKDAFRFNMVEKTIEVHKGVFKDTPSEVLETVVTDWLQRHYELQLSVSEVGSRILRMAYANRYDPLADYLNGLVWDRVPRLKTFFFKYVEAMPQNRLGQDITEHLERIGERWFISAVARALDPGCQVDTVLVLEGLEGKRKTSALRVLGGKWFVETQLVLGDKDTKMIAGTNWIVELSELASMRKSETDALKAFVTCREDKYRPPYGRKIERAPRRCIFVGTTNDAEYLAEGHGKRRFWPVCVEHVDLPALERDRDQLWAEAVALFRAGDLWYLNEVEQAVANAQAEERVGESVIEAKVGAWWYGTNPKTRPKIVTTIEVAETVLHHAFDRITRLVQMEIGHAMRRLGFGRERRKVNGRGQVWVYVPTQAMLEAPQGCRSSQLRAIAGAKPTAMEDSAP